MICVKIRHQGKVVGTGLGVLERHYIGLYAIHVHRDYRRQGLAMNICSQIIEKGKSMGATQAHLQVRQGNTGAFLMYETLGLRKIDVYKRQKHESLILAQDERWRRA